MNTVFQAGAPMGVPSSVYVIGDPHLENPTWDRLVVQAWEGDRGRLLAAVNYGPTQAQGYALVPFARLEGRVLLRDLLSDASYVREGAELGAKGLYLDLPPWGYHAFAVERAS